MKRVAILGSTGSIGRQTLDVIRQFPDDLQVTALAANQDGKALAAQATEHKVQECALYAESGMSGLLAICRSRNVDLVVVSVAGVIGLEPTLAAIEAGKAIALASKEVLVAAGEVVMPLVHKYGTSLTPIDSEHSAIFQCIQGYPRDQIARLILTASGGPFRGWQRRQLAEITVAQALAHPTWRMGGKITIDSATMMNKALEMIEARWLFDVEIDHIDVVVHPQSVIHSMVKLSDGSVLGQLGWPDMRLPIAVALLHPKRLPNELPAWNPTDTPNLTFESLDESVFPSLAFARQAVKIGGTAPCIFNAANEAAANAFLNGQIAFLDIWQLVAHALGEVQAKTPTLENLLKADAQARDFVRKHILTATH